MLIKYKLIFQKNGMTITQEIDSESSSQVKPGAGALQKVLQGNFIDSKAAAQNNPGGNSQTGGAGGPSDTGGAGGPSDTGGAGVTAGGSPITIFGPFILMCPDQDDFDELIEVDEDE